MEIFSKIFSSIIILSLTVFISCSDNSNDPPDDNNTQTYPGYNLVWSDEFNGTSLDQTKWNYETGTGVNGDFGTGQIDRATNRIENVSIVNNITGADDLGNMFQFKHDFEGYFCGARSLQFSKSLNPELQSFEQWLNENISKMQVG